MDSDREANASGCICFCQYKTCVLNTLKTVPQEMVARLVRSMNGRTGFMTALQLVGRKHLVRPSMTYDKLATPSLCTRLSDLRDRRVRRS